MPAKSGTPAVVGMLETIGTSAKGGTAGEESLPEETWTPALEGMLATPGTSATGAIHFRAFLRNGAFRYVYFLSGCFNKNPQCNK